MRNFAIMFLCSIILCCGLFGKKAEAFENVCILLDNETSAFISGNSWDAVVTEKTFTMPNLTVRTRGFNDETYNLSVTWERIHRIEKEEVPVYKMDKKGRFVVDKKTKQWIKIGTKIREIDHGIKWEPTKVIKNGIIVDANSVKMKFDDLFTELTGRNAVLTLETEYSKPTLLGLEEFYGIRKYGGCGVGEPIIKNLTTFTPNHDAYGNIKYYDEETTNFSIYVIDSRITKQIVGYTHIITATYFPIINEYTNVETFLNEYTYAKNQNNQWKSKELKGSYTSWYNTPDAIAEKLDNVKAALGI